MSIKIYILILWHAKSLLLSFYFIDKYWKTEKIEFESYTCGDINDIITIVILKNENYHLMSLLFILDWKLSHHEHKFYNIIDYLKVWKNKYSIFVSQSFKLYCCLSSDASLYEFGSTLLQDKALATSCTPLE